jgi:hypothetical protein
VTPEIISGFVAKWRAAEYEVSSINRALQVLRRMLHLAVEWGKSEKAAPRVLLLPGERRRERALSTTEEAPSPTRLAMAFWQSTNVHFKAYEQLHAANNRSSRRTRSCLRDVATVLLDCGLRPEECYRLR